jgi:hypothetical protein
MIIPKHLSDRMRHALADREPHRPRVRVEGVGTLLAPSPGRLLFVPDGVEIELTPGRCGELVAALRAVMEVEG